MATEQLQLFASLDFPGRSTLLVWEIADRLGCSCKHLFNEIDAGALVVLDLAAKGSNRRCARVPIECYRDYIFKRFTGPVAVRMQFLRDLPPPVKRQLIEELKLSLR